MKIYIAILFIIAQFSLYSQNTNQTVTEYNYIFNKENTFNLETTNNTEISFMIERRGLPLVNRLVRFISLTPDLFTFENGLDELIIATDEEGVASATMNLVSSGRGIIAIHMLYVGSTGATNISHEEFSTVNINPKSYFKEDANGTIDVKISAVISIVIVPYLFLATITMLLVSYFKSIYKECHLVKSNVLMATLFGFSSIKKRFDLMIIFVVIELLSAGYFIISTSYLVPIVFIALSLSSFSMKRNRAYAIGFFLFASVSMTYITLHHLINYFGIIITPKITFSTNFIFMFFIFLFITAFLSSSYIPIAFLTLYSIILPVNHVSIIAALLGILLASILYIVKVKYSNNIPIFYVINLLKIED